MEVLIGAKDAEHFDPAHNGHDDIQQDEIEIGTVLEGTDGVRPVFGLDHLFDIPVFHQHRNNFV